MRKTDRIKLVAGTALIAVIGIAPLAHAGTMGNGSQQRNMIVVNKCLAMPHDKMMGDQGCKSMMAVHPELFPGGTVTPANATHH
jgi:hypothetical protein